MGEAAQAASSKDCASAVACATPAINCLHYQYRQLRNRFSGSPVRRPREIAARANPGHAHLRCLRKSNCRREHKQRPQHRWRHDLHIQLATTLASRAYIDAIRREGRHTSDDTARRPVRPDSRCLRSVLPRALQAERHQARADRPTAGAPREAMESAHRPAILELLRP